MKPLSFIFGLMLAAVLPAAAIAMDITVTSAQIETYRGAQFGEQVDELIWRGGIVMTSPDNSFGGLSGITFTGDGKRLAIVSDIGNFISGTLIYDPEGRPLGFGGTMLNPIENSKGVELPRSFAKDAEAIDTIYRDGKPAAVRVAFENLTRVADFELIDGHPMGPARVVAIPKWLERIRTNKSLEAVCIAPSASPVAGSTMLFTEGAPAGNGYAGYMLGNRDRGEVVLKAMNGFNPTDCAFLPNGDLLVLERGTSFLTFTMQVRRINANDVRPGAELSGDIILTGSGTDIDNMEGIAVHQAPNGETRITIISDDNFNAWERTLLLEFALPK